MLEMPHTMDKSGVFELIECSAEITLQVIAEAYLHASQPFVNLSVAISTKGILDSLIPNLLP